MSFFRFLVLFVFLFCISELRAEAYIVDTPVLNVRSCASTNCKIIGKIKSGEHVNSIKDHGEWIEIEREKGTGFVVKRALVKNDSALNLFVSLIITILTVFIFFVIVVGSAKGFERSTPREEKKDKIEKALGIKERTIADWKKLFTFITTDGEITIKSYKGTDPIVAVPEFIGKNPVTAIDKADFSEKNKIY